MAEVRVTGVGFKACLPSRADWACSIGGQHDRCSYFRNGHSLSLKRTAAPAPAGGFLTVKAEAPRSSLVAHRLRHCSWRVDPADAKEAFNKHGPDIAVSRRTGNLSLGLTGMRVLNDILRPFMSEWHPKLEDDEATNTDKIGKAEWKANWRDGDACRSRYRLNDNVAFSAAHSGRFKHFPRFHIATSGALTIYAIGNDPIGENWAKALENRTPVPPRKKAGTPMLYYIWGRTFP
jgi:hypothetical protein